MALPGPVSAGDPIKAADFNSVVREIRALKQIGNQQGRTKTSEHLPAGVIRVRNDFAFRLRRWDTVGVDDMLIETELDVLESLNIGQTRLFSVTKPQPRHVSRWAVLHQALMPGEIGLATVEGVTPVRVGFSNSTRIQDRILDSIYGDDPSDTSTGVELHGVALYASDFAEWATLVGIYNDNSSLIPDAAWYWLISRNSNGASISNIERLTYNPTENERYSTTPSKEAINDPPPNGNAAYDGPAEGSVLSFHKGYKSGPQLQGRLAFGSTTFKCVNSRWEESSNTCETGSSSWYYIEYENAIYAMIKAGIWPDLRGTPGWNGLEYPCVEGEEISSVGCLYDYNNSAIATAVLAHPEIRINSHECSHSTTCVYECISDGENWNWYMTRTCREPCRCVSLDTDLYPCDGVVEPSRVQLPCRPTTTTTTTPPSTTSHPPTCGDSLPTGVVQPFVPEGYMCDYECRCVGEDNWTWVLVGNNCSSFSELCSCDAAMDNVGGVPWSPQYCSPSIAGTIYSKECVAAADTTTTAAPLEECDCNGSCVWECSYVEPGNFVANQGPNLEAWQLASSNCNPASRVCNCGSLTPSGPCVAPDNIGDIETFDCGRTTTSQPPDTGACCSPSGTCLVKAEEFCESPSIWLGVGTTCNPNNPCLTTTTTTTTSAPPCGQCEWTFFVPPSQWSNTDNTCVDGCVCDEPPPGTTGGQTATTYCYTTTTTTTTTTTSAPPTTTTTTTSEEPTTTTSEEPTTTTSEEPATTTTTTTTTTTSAPPGVGACCDSGNTCYSGVTESECESIYAGTYQGDDTTCSPNPCG